MILRRAVDADRPAIADLHVANWQATYRGTLPDAFLDDDAPPALREQWLARPAQDGRLVAVVEDRGTIAAFVSVKPIAPSALIDNLHVTAAHRGKGLGRRLLGWAAERIAEEGLSAAHLLVLEGNGAAEAFYRGLGAVETWRGLDDHFDSPVTAIRLDWPDIGALARACGASTPSP
ncbi:MAG: GNAT family N-acetyltransferase [Rubricella sp.]